MLLILNQSLLTGHKSTADLGMDRCLLDTEIFDPSKYHSIEDLMMLKRRNSIYIEYFGSKKDSAKDEQSNKQKTASRCTPEGHVRFEYRVSSA